MNENHANKLDLTSGSIPGNLIRFAIPFLISCFLQTFYGLADLFITGQFNGADAITAVSVGSQVLHMLTVVIAGFATGSTVIISRATGARDSSTVKNAIGNTIIIFGIFAAALTLAMLFLSGPITRILDVPEEALSGTTQYLLVCSAGIIFITGYNVICGIFRGLGDSKTPLYFVAIAGVINIGLDYLLIGPFSMGALGAGLATVIAQAISVIIAMVYAVRKVPEFRIKREHLHLKRSISRDILRIGVFIALQEGLIQVGFLVITAIANARGLDTAAAVGIVEKLISFMFLVPSAMLSSVSTIASASIGAEKRDRGRKTLWYAIGVCCVTGFIFCVICWIFDEDIIRLFAGTEEMVIILGAQYLKPYVTDTIVAGIHFCFSGYFSAYKKSFLIFAHNMLSVVLVRIPGAYFASVMFLDTLFPMGMAAPLGSLLSVFICIGMFLYIRRRNPTVF